MSYHSTIFAPRVAPQGLGAGDDLPWAQYSSATQALQAEINKALKANGYCSISEDGKLGPATCGAIAEMLMYTDTGVTPPATCQSFNPPKKPPCGTSSSSVTSSSSSPTLAFEPMVPPSSGPSQSTMVVAGVAVLAVGVLGYAIAKKKGMIK